MSTMGTIASDQFKGQQNVDDGCRRGSDTTLREFLAQAKVDILAIETKTKKGTLTAAGAGTESVVFGSPFANVNYRVYLSSDTVTVLPIWASKTVGGFDIVVAAGGDVDWLAILD